MKACFLCGDINNVLSFNITEYFHECIRMWIFRENENLDYADVSLDGPMDNMGYHAACFHKFMNLDRDNLQRYENFIRIGGREKLRAQRTFPTEDVEVELTSAVIKEEFDIEEMSLDIVKDEVTEEDIESILQEEQCHEPQPSTSSSSSSALSATEDRCLFCLQRVKRIGKRREQLSLCSSVAIVNRVREQAEQLGDLELMERLSTCISYAYHRICFSRFKSVYNTRFKAPTIEGPYHEVRNMHVQAFECLTAFIEVEIIQNEKIFLLHDLNSTYKNLLLECNPNCSWDEVKCSKSYNLEKKILSSFGDRICISADTSRHIVKGKIIYKQGLDINKLVHDCFEQQSAEKTKFQDVAFSIRHTVRCVETKPLPTKLKVENILEGECDIPDLLLQHITDLIKGPDIRRQQSTHDDIKIKSICEDIIYTIQNGRVRPSKHLLLGLAMKSLTNSRKVLTILNRYGHCASYTQVEELETELSFTAIEDSAILPFGIRATKDLCTNVAFDNFDRFVDTFTGKDTLHDTVGIIYQFAVKDHSVSVSLQEERPISHDARVPHPPKKRRRFDALPTDIQPYNKTPKASTTLLPIDTITPLLSCGDISKQHCQFRNLLWAFSLCYLPSTPMWVGFNSRNYTDNSEMQTVGYLPQINESPTSYSVVYKTMTNAQDIRKACGQEKIIVTYDLAIATMAMRIQLEEKNCFDDLFINMGSFHMEIAFFKALGKFIDGSGVVDVLVHSGVLAHGSINGLVDGKHYNRCKRIHTLLAGALQSLHIAEFCTHHDINVDDLKVPC